MNSSPILRRGLIVAGACALALSLAHAQTVAPPDVPPAVAPDTSQPKPTQTSTPPLETLLAARGEITLDDLLRESGLAASKLTPESRARLERTLNERNEAMRRANERVADEVRRALNVSDTQIAQSISDEADRRSMERIRKFQPKRYEALMRQRRKAEQQQTPAK